MAIPNINQLTAELRMMPDQALQRMAMMYKQDPYIFPMVISEDMARKKMRAAAQAQMAQPQPKVADQAIMSMGTPPQEAGIAGLQAPNMERMADGGIAGYAEGGVADTAEDAFSRGGMFDFTQRSEPVVRMADGGVARFQAGGQPTGITAKGQAVGVTPYGGIYGGERLLPATTGYEGLSIDEFLKAAYADVSDYVKSLYDKIPKESLAQVAAADLAKKKSREAAERPAAGGARSAGVGGAQAGEREAYEAQLAGAPAPSAAPSGGTRSYAAPDASAPIASSTGASARVAAPSVEAAKKTAAEFLDSQAIERRIADYQKAEAADVESARERRKKALEGQGKAYEGLEALLKKEEEGSKGELEQSKAMAILNAGLAMMAGTSPRALENIGKGAMVGTGQYAEAIKDFKKSAKERQRAMADIEQARRAEARADTDAQLKFEERADERLGNARKYGIEALNSLGITNANTARQIYTTQVEQQGATERARMQVNAPPAQIQFLTSLGRAMGAKDSDSALKLGFELQTREQRIPALYEKYVASANSQKISLTGKGTEGEEFMRKYPTFETYLRGMSVQPGVTAGGTGGGFVQPPAGASILR